MGIDIVAVDPLDPAQAELFAGWQRVLEESARIEYGDDHGTDTVDETRALFRHQRYERRMAWAAVEGNDVVGHVEVMLPGSDNQHRVEMTLAVRPDRRRRGIGSALFGILERIAQDEGRTVLGCESDAASGHADPAEPFATRLGFRAAQRERRSRLDLPVDAAPALAEAEKHADGYEVLTAWDGMPDEWRADRAVLSQRMSTDVPVGDLDVTEESWDAERVAYEEVLLREQGRRVVETVARHRATGRLVAFTDLVLPPEGGRAFQWSTLVLHEHRGHRLGLLVKAANLQALVAERPDVHSVQTWNAYENEPMLRVNRALGFVQTGELTEWQKTLR